jgi:hypothetical protein
MTTQVDGGGGRLTLAQKCWEQWEQVPTMRMAAFGQGAPACWQRFLTGMIAAMFEGLQQAVVSSRSLRTR